MIKRTEEEIEKLERDFEHTRTKLRDSKRSGDIEVEMRYALAYQNLVNAGLRMQLKRKYRVQ